MRILFADPHPHFAPLVIPQFLAEHEVRWVPTVAEAREALRQDEFAAVLVDLDFPDGSGVELVRELRSRSFGGRIVAVSAKESGNEALERAGADATCPKARFQGIAGALPAEPARRPAAAPPALRPAPSPAPPVPEPPPVEQVGAACATFPVLDPPFSGALRSAMHEILEGFSPLAVLAAGSAVRGRTSPRSDLDLLVLARGQRRRVQRRLERVPVDLVVETPESLSRLLEEQWAARRPVLAHMLATGEVVLDLEELLEDLRVRARRLMERPPQAEAWELGLARIDLAAALDDALDLEEADPAAAALALERAVRLAIEYPFRERSRHLPREKDLLRALGTLDPQAAEQAASFAASRDRGERRRLALELSLQVTGEAGFSDWDSGARPG